MPTFGQVLVIHLRTQRMSQREFARRVGMTSAFVNQVIKGHAAPMWTRCAEWSAALGLTGEAARHFMQEMALAGAPPPVQKLVKDLRRQARIPGV